MKKLEVTCDICKRKITGKDEQSLNRALGTHRQRSHGIVGRNNDPVYRGWEALRRYHQKRGQPMPFKSLEEYAKHRAANATELRKSVTPAIVRHYKRIAQKAVAVPIFLDHCPCCKARFWAAQG